MQKVRLKSSQGPNPVLVFAADQKLYSGADRSLLLSTKGRQKAIGPDRTARLGPNMNFVNRIMDEEIRIK